MEDQYKNKWCPFCRQECLGKLCVLFDINASEQCIIARILKKFVR
jgi:hypothetical protein